MNVVSESSQDLRYSVRMAVPFLLHKQRLAECPKYLGDGRIFKEEFTGS